MKHFFSTLLLTCILYQAGAQQTPQGPPAPPQKQQFAQRNAQAQRERIEMYKVQFVTQKLKLTKEEAEAFWPVYEANRREMQEIVKSNTGDEIVLQEAILNSKKKFKTALKPVLKSEDRINQALKIDREFLNRMKGEMGRRNAEMGKRKVDMEKRKLQIEKRRAEMEKRKAALQNKKG